MNKKSILLLFLLLVTAAAIAPAHARVGKATGGSVPLSSVSGDHGFVLLHPYFTGKSWRTTAENIELIAFPDAFSGVQGLTPVLFEFGKNIESTIAIFTTAQGDLYQMPVSYKPYFGACYSGGLEFSAVQKISLPGITLTSGTPVYLVKDPPQSLDSIRIVVGASAQFLCCLTVKVSNSSIIRIDTLLMQGASQIVRIEGDYSVVSHRDTAIWAVGASGTIRSFSANPSSWGAERKWDISGTSDTIKCINGNYVGTNTGKIYKKSGAQTFVQNYTAGPNKAINAIYPQAAIGNNGNFIDFVVNFWRPDTLGASNYSYANFIRKPGGFGVELLDEKWHLSSFTYRDSASKIDTTFPVDYKPDGVSKTHIFSSSIDTGVTVRILDPDSSYRDVEISLKSGSTKTVINSDGPHTIASVPDSEPCQFDAVRLSTGILNVRLNAGSFTLREGAELGTPKVDCNSCYWKKFEFIVQKNWIWGDTLIIRAGKDSLKIVNHGQSVTTISSTARLYSHPEGFRWRVAGNQLVLHLPFNNLKSFSLFDISGRRIFSHEPSAATTVTVPLSCSHAVLFINLVFSDGTSRRAALSIIH